MNSPPIGVYVYSADPVLHSGVANQLRSRPEITLDDDVNSASIAVLAADEIDEETARMTRVIHRNGRRVVLVISKLDEAGVLTGAEAGASGFLRRAEAVPDRLLSVIRQAAEGSASVPPDLVGGLLLHIGRLNNQVLAPRGMTLSGFTQRELAVLRLVADGVETAEIAARLSYSERTVKGVIHAVTTRLQLKNRAQAVAYAVRLGLI